MLYIKNPATEWYSISNIREIDSPALIVYKENVEENIRLVKSMVRNVDMLRPHIKTNKMAEVCELLLQAGISRFKCATIAEAEMLAGIQARDVLLAYQPVGPKISRFINLIKAYPAVSFSCITDNEQAAQAIADLAAKNNIVIEVYIDLNIGMNRTGILPADTLPLIGKIQTMKGIQLVGLHAYDGHIRDTDLALRKQHCDAAFKDVTDLKDKAAATYSITLKIVVGGTPTFPIHAQRDNVECSPGTFIFNDWGYKTIVPDEPFEYAALVMTRIISIVDAHTICTDLGHKSVAAENPLPRVYFLNAPEATPIGQSEEHLVLQVADASAFDIGDVLYGVPIHICPTVALYEKAYVSINNTITTEWKVVARDRFITF